MASDGSGKIFHEPNPPTGPSPTPRFTSHPGPGPRPSTSTGNTPRGPGGFGGGGREQSYFESTGTLFSPEVRKTHQKLPGVVSFGT